METMLSIFLLLTVPLIFCFAIAYFFALHGYKKRIVEEMPDVWDAARSKARPFESWIPTAYKLLQKSKNGSLDGRQPSISLVAAHKKAKILLYVTASLFILLLLTGLSLDAITN